MHEVSHGMIHEDININEFPRYYYTRKIEFSAACFDVIITTIVKGQTNYCILFSTDTISDEKAAREITEVLQTARIIIKRCLWVVHAVLYRRGSVLVVHHPESGEIFWVL